METPRTGPAAGDATSPSRGLLHSGTPDDLARTHRGGVRPHRAGPPAGRLRRRLPDRHPRQHGLQAPAGARARPAGHAGESRRGLPDARRDRAGPGGRAGRGHRQPARDGHDVRVPADGVQAMDSGRRHASTGAGGLQHRLRGERRAETVARERSKRAVERADAGWRPLLRRHHPPGADRRGEAGPGGQHRRSSRSSAAKNCGTSASWPITCRRQPTGRSSAASAA